eukprot:m.26552 g.26552  ORF g.26552 m.26552 type:complete len:631 (-) comp4324_c0_seq1:60-1952(-)
MDPSAFLWAGQPGQLAAAPSQPCDDDRRDASSDGERGGRLHERASPSSGAGSGQGAAAGDTLTVACDAARLIAADGGWRPSWDALGVPSRAFSLPGIAEDHTGHGACGQTTASVLSSRTESMPNACGPGDESTDTTCVASHRLGLRLRDVFSARGSLPCAEVCVIDPDGVAASVGVACGDVILEVNSDIQLGEPTRRVEHALANVWNRGLGATLVVVPAMQARVLTRRAAANRASVEMYDGEEEEEVDPGPEITERVVVGIFRIPLFRDKDSTRKVAKSSVLDRLFGSGKSPLPPRTRSPHDLTAQTARAYILQQTIHLLNAREASDSKSIIQSWLTDIQPALVREFGEGLVNANSEFLLELLSYHASEDTVSGTTTTNREASPTGAVQTDTGARSSMDGAVSTLHASDKDGAGSNVVLSSSAASADGVSNTDPHSSAYVFIDNEGADGQRQLDAALSAAQAAWAAEKQRRRVKESSSGQLPGLVGSMHSSVSPGSSVNEGPHGATDGSGDVVGAGAAAYTSRRSRRGTAPPSPGTQAKAAAKAHRAALEKHAKDTLAAAEEAWAAEKRLHEAKTAQRDEKRGLHHHRARGGRVVQRQRSTLLEPSDEPEPNRPWFGGSSGGGSDAGGRA